jgi:hypothetical protein
MKPDPQAIARWWRALHDHYADPKAVVLRCHNWGQTFEVHSGDLDALLSILESLASPSGGDVSQKLGIQPSKEPNGL